MYCRNCGEEIADDSRFCPHCGFNTRASPCGTGDVRPCNPGPSVTYREKSEFLAILFSFFITGSGHIYVGRTEAGIKLLLLQILVFVLTWLLGMMSPILAVVGLASIVLWFYAMYDAHQVCKEYNRGLRDTGFPPW